MLLPGDICIKGSAFLKNIYFCIFLSPFTAFMLHNLCQSDAILYGDMIIQGTTKIIRATLCIDF